MTEPLISPHAYVGEGVELGERVAIGPNSVVLGPTRIGDRVWIGPGACIGTPPEIATIPQNTAWSGDLQHSGVEIGDDSVIREHAVITQGSSRTTRVGAKSWILNSAYIAHDVFVGEGVTVSAGVTVGGHVDVGDLANIGMNASIHQRRVIGPGAMIGMGTAVTRDVAPFTKVYGSPPRAMGLNGFILRRLGVPESEFAALSDLAEGEDSERVLARFTDSSSGVRELLAWWAGHSELKLTVTGRTR